MNKLTVEQIRTTFTDFFKNNNHEHVQSSSLIPQNDPSLMFVNSGMVQFKNLFTGMETRNYTRATSYQKSVRAGGKHNDLDNVGYTARHHTFFEMLGNFSFGGYFKEEAIYYAWTLLTEHFQLPKNKLYVTVYHTDTEAADLWKKIAGLSDERIIKINTDDNFWSMGETGPCGPCSEIFYDHGDHIPGGLPGTPEQDGDRFIEIWNLVFMQYEQVDKNTRILLPKKSVDTGMGLERISAVIQGVHDNYDIDVFKEIINFTESIIGVKAKDEALFSYRIIADHLRSCAFLIADGVMPSNEGRGYVLRRIMRRAMRHAHQLGAKDPLMYKLLPKLVDLFGNTYTELNRARDFISSVLKQEEEQFKITLDRGLKLLNDEVSSISKNGALSGEVAFKLYDTYGFPLDLTEDILKKQNIKVDIENFNLQMNLQKEKARKAWVGSGESKTDVIWYDIMTKFGATEFLGYSLEQAEGKVLALVQDGKQIEQITEIDTKFTLIVNQTPFYGESGGQMGDIGEIITANGKIKVTNTLKFLGKVIGHVCVLKSGAIHVNDEIKMVINADYRSCLKMHHTATHILHAVLRNVLGNHITQKGSMVVNDKLRFDFSHLKAMTKEEIKIVEDKVNAIIWHNSQVVTNIMSTDEAVKSGAMALFGEKYDDEVRVVSLGHQHIDINPYSFELCGGTHVSRTGDIGIFKILSESAIASGVRRIEAVCGRFALNEVRKNEELLNGVIDTLKTNKSETLQKLNTLISSKKDLEKQLEKVQLNSLRLSDDDIKQQSITISDTRFIYKQINDNLDAKIIRIATEDAIKKHENLILIFTNIINNKLSIIVAISKQISDKYNANDIAKKLATELNGSGGGQATLAQVGSNDLKALNGLEQKIVTMLKDA